MPQRPAGYFITFEGPDGSGKSTQIQWLAAHLRERGLPIYQTREPGGTPISEEIRKLVHDLRHQEMADRAEILLYSAARAQLVRQEIRPHLAAGDLVLSDRYADSTLAYQGYGHGLDLDTLRQITAFATDGLRPDLTLLFDIDAETGLARRKQGGVEWNRLDAYDLDFHRRVRAGYLEMCAAEPARWICLDATQDRQTLQAEVRRVVKERLEIRD
jgi:dTMP kinase